MKTDYFIVNAFSVLLIHSLGWIATIFARQMDPKLQIPGTWRYVL